MIIIIKSSSSLLEIKRLTDTLQIQGLQIERIEEKPKMVLRVMGNTKQRNYEQWQQFSCVEQVIPLEVPYTQAARAFHADDTIITLKNGSTIGGKKLAIMAGPCSVETMEQIQYLATKMATLGATVMRGGAFKPRTSPYSFQGLKEKGLDMLCRTARAAHLPVVTEIMAPHMIDIFLEKKVDIIQIGARNMQNFDLLQAVGKTQVPVLLKRGLCATIEEWLMAAEYIMAAGNPHVILCERGIRTYETYTRNTLDLSAVLAVKRQSHLPIIVDPSHASGKRWMVPALAKAAIACGADGIMVEVHPRPEEAWCDGEESITPETFGRLVDDLRQLAPLVGREI